MTSIGVFDTSEFHGTRAAENFDFMTRDPRTKTDQSRTYDRTGPGPRKNGVIKDQDQDLKRSRNLGTNRARTKYLRSDQLGPGPKFI